MSTSNSLGNQIEILITFGNYLANIQSNLLFVNNSYKKALEDLRNAGMYEEIAQSLEYKNLSQFQKKMAIIINHLSEEDFNYTKQLLNEINEKLSAIKR